MSEKEYITCPDCQIPMINHEACKRCGQPYGFEEAPEGHNICSKCLLEIPVDTVFWIGPKNNVLCKSCLPKAARPVGIRQ